MKLNILLGASIIIILLVGCNGRSKTDEENISGTWLFDQIESNAPGSISEKANFELSVAQIKSNSWFILMSDHKYVSFFNGDSTMGDWEIINKGKNLITRENGKTADTAIIEKLTKDRMILVSKDGESETKITLSKAKH
jgi:hypothetical protein